MVEKRFNQMCASNDYCIGWDNKLDEGLSIDDTIKMLNKLSEENKQLRNKINVLDDGINDVVNDLRLIKHILDFLFENNIEYEAETIHECLERLLKVVEPYYDEMGDV